MKKTKDVYDDNINYDCVQFNNCAECSGCFWFENIYLYSGGVNKLPMTEYEYQDVDL